MASQPPQRRSSEVDTNGRKQSVDFKLSGDTDNTRKTSISRETEGQNLIILNSSRSFKSIRTNPNPNPNPNGNTSARILSNTRATSSRKVAQVHSSRRLANNDNDPAPHFSSSLSEEKKEIFDQNEDEMTFLLPEINHQTSSFDIHSNETKLIQETWPFDHVMLLYMLSRYAVCAKTSQDKETWIREIPLLVLMYEGIAAGVLNFDYAPAAMLIPQEGKSKRIWMNVTQDGKSAIDDLREANLINGLKVSTQDFHSISAFQVSLRGLLLLNQVGKELRAKVDSFIYAPKPYRHELLKIRYIPIKDRPESEMIFNVGAATIKNRFHPREEEEKKKEEFKEEKKNFTFTSTSTSTSTPNTGTTDTTGTLSFPLSSSPIGSIGTTPDSRKNEMEDFFNEEGRFALESMGYSRYSEVTETEDVSYVSSPFIPFCVRGKKTFEELHSNTHRALEAANGQSNIRDILAEAIILSNPVCIVGEWIPFGSNQIVALNERLGSMDRCQGGLFTSLIDDRPTDTQFEVPPGLTQVNIVDFDPVRFINFEAEINFPEKEGIVQIEHFGIHLNVDGSIFYGIKVESILDRLSDTISIDLLSRLLVDIHQDSSEIMDDLLSSYQNSLLDMVFLGDYENRGKFNLILAEEIDPFMEGNAYLDRGIYENELKQILGNLHAAYDIGEDSVMILGRDGILVAGSASKCFEQIFVAFFSLFCREIFVRHFFKRIFILEENLKKIRCLILNTKKNPNAIFQIPDLLNQASNDLILFTDTLGYLMESLEFIQLPKIQNLEDLKEKNIHEFLNLPKIHQQIVLRAKDLEKLVHGAKYDLINLRQMADILNTNELENIFQRVEQNTREITDETSQIMEKANFSLEISQYLLGGSFAFTLIDRISGGTLHLTQIPKWIQDIFVHPLIDKPFVFFFLNLLWMVIVWYLIGRYRKQQNLFTANRLMLRVQLNQPLLLEKFEIFLEKKKPQKQESDAQIVSERRRVVWQEKSDLYMNWRQIVHEIFLFFRQVKTLKQVWKTINKPIQKSPWLLGKRNDPRIEVEYDSRYGFLLFVTFHCRQPNAMENKNRHEKRKKKLEKMDKKLQQQKKQKQQKTQTDIFSKIRQNVTSSFSPTSIKTTTTNNNNNDEKQLEDLEHHLLRTFAEDLQQHQVIQSVASFLNE